MKKLTILPIVLLAIGCAPKSATITIANKGCEDSTIYVYRPVGRSVMNVTDTLTVKDGATATITMTVDELSTMMARNSDNYASLIIEPGGNYNLTFDKQAGVQVDDSAQMRINRILKDNSFYKYEFVRDYSKAPLDTVASVMLANFEALIAQDKAKFADIEMSPEKRKFIETQIELLWIGSLSKVIRSNYSDMTRGSGKPMYEGYAELYKTIHEKYPLTKEMIPSGMFMQFADMKGLIELVVSGEKLPTHKTAEEYLQMKHDDLNRTITDPEIHQAAMAQMIYFDCINNKLRNPVIIKHIELFNTKYPENVYKAVYEPFIKDINEFQERIKGDFSPEVKFVADGDKINKFEDLLTQFKGKPIFIDFWFSSCSPCCEEFKYSAELKKFLKEKGVEMLYISVDRKDENWHNAIKFNNLDGNHIRTTRELHTDLYETYKISYFPHYMLIGADGKILINRTKNPSDGAALEQQIAEAI